MKGSEDKKKKKKKGEEEDGIGRVSERSKLLVEGVFVSVQAQDKQTVFLPPGPEAGPHPRVPLLLLPPSPPPSPQLLACERRLSFVTNETLRPGGPLMRGLDVVDTGARSPPALTAAREEDN